MPHTLSTEQARELAKKRVYFTEEQITEGLMALIVWAGSSTAASRYLKTEKGISIHLGDADELEDGARRPVRRAPRKVRGASLEGRIIARTRIPGAGTPRDIGRAASRARADARTVAAGDRQGQRSGEKRRERRDRLTQKMTDKLLSASRAGRRRSTGNPEPRRDPAVTGGPEDHPDSRGGRVDTGRAGQWLRARGHQMITMYDSITVSQIPANAEAVAGYTSGHWPTYNELVQKFPHAHVLSIAVGASHAARCLDVEPGDAVTPTDRRPVGTCADFTPIVTRESQVLYTSASNVNALVSTMTAARIFRNQYYIWSAHYTFHEHICSPGACGYPSADATQWTDKAMGRNLDQSQCQDYFFGAAPAPKPPIPTPPTEEEIVAISSTVAANGTLHVFVEAKDGSVWYTYQPKGTAAWQGGKPGKQIAGLSHFAPAPK